MRRRLGARRENGAERTNRPPLATDHFADISLADGDLEQDLFGAPKLGDRNRIGLIDQRADHRFEIRAEIGLVRAHDAFGSSFLTVGERWAPWPTQ